MNLVYPDPIQGPNSPFAKSFAYQLMPYDPAAVVLQVNLRDYFAAAALQGNLASQSIEVGYYDGADSWNKAATDAYKAADAMIKAREVKP